MQPQKKELPLKSDHQTSINEKENIKVYINKKGEIKIDGKTKKLKELDLIFKNLSEKNGVIFYSRSKIYDGDIWINFLDLVAKYELPIAIFTDKTFTKRIGN